MSVQQQDDTVTNRYYYAIKEISVGGRKANTLIIFQFYSKSTSFLLDDITLLYFYDLNPYWNSKSLPSYKEEILLQTFLYET